MSMNKKIAILFVLMGAIMYAVWRPSINDGPASAHVLASKTTAAPSRTLNILFLGNSYTFVNDMPAMLVDIASSDPDNAVAVKVKSVTRGGANLLELWNQPAVKQALASQHWDYVVLQNQSEWAMLELGITLAREGAERLVYAIKKAGAVPLLYETWQRKPGSVWYSDPKTQFLHNPLYMKQMLHYQTALLASQFRMGVVPAGVVWGEVLDAKPDFPLYAPDGSHPSVTGTYLVALTFYHTLIKKDVSEVEFVPSGMDAANAVFLKDFINRH